MKFLKYFYLAVGVLLLVIVLQNLEPSGLNVLVWSYEMPKGVLWFLLLLIGFLLSEMRHLFNRPKNSEKVSEKKDKVDIKI